MTRLVNAYHWAVAHPVEAGALLSAIVAALRVLYAGLARVLAPYPRVRASLEALAALAPDVLRAAVMLARAVTGLPLPSLAVDSRDAEIAQLRARVDAFSGPIAQRRAPCGVAVRAAVAVLATVLLVGCPWLRGAVMDVTPGVPSRSSCVAPASRCEGAVPVVCSQSGRWWSATPASAPCPYGCLLDHDAGAYCAPRDAGGVE